MSQPLFPEIQAAAEALGSRIALTESEISEIKECIKEKKALVRSWRKAIAALAPRTVGTKKKQRAIKGAAA